MGENEHQSREWSIDIDKGNNVENEHQSRERSIGIDQGNNVEEVLEHGPDCCIYRVPQILRKINEEAYTPCFISIGPLHYGKKELIGMESQKRRFWSEFEERVGEQKLDEFKTYIKNQEKYIRGHYSVTSKLQSSEYIAMVLLDAVFIIELFVKGHRGHKDFLLSNTRYMSSIQLDLLLLENQIPYFVLNHLYSSVFPSSEDPSFFDLCLEFFVEVSMMFNWSIPEQPQLKHFTDFLRHGAILEVQPTDQPGGFIIDLPCATKLKKSGLEFRGEHICLHQVSLEKRKLGKWLPWFGVNELQIPRIIISDETEIVFRNMMALEIFHYPKQTYICHYADLMDRLIDTDKDVDLLVEKGVIINWVGDIEPICRMFNRLNLQTSIGQSPYYEDVEKMKAHYRYPWNHLKATLKDVYFNNLWTGTATIAAAFLLILTVIQTVYSIKKC